MSNIQANNRRSPPDLQIEVLFDSGVDSPASSARLRYAAGVAAGHRGFTQGEIGIRVTADAGIREINRRHLHHDYATDVISFSYRADLPRIDGEIVVSAETARRQASAISRQQSGWNAERELLLYTVHGVLHITGMEDEEPIDRQRMRAAEQIVMRLLGIDQIDRFGADSISFSAAGHSE